MIALIAARAKNGVIGKNGDLPWRLPSDLAHFKTITKGFPVVMGSKTFTSIGKALPERANIVVSSRSDFAAEGATVAHSLESALSLAASLKRGDELIFIIGGASLYTEALEKGLADIVYLTEIEEAVEGDTYFPTFPPVDWKITDQSDTFTENNHSFTFTTYQKN